MVPIPINDLRAREHVGSQLRTMREKAEFTLDIAARQLRLPPEVLDRMESGRLAVPPPLAQSMTQTYGEPDSDVVIMARLVRHRGQPDDYAAWNLDQLTWESCTTRVCEVAVTHIPELLQTSAYAQAAYTSHAYTARAPQIKYTPTGKVAEHSIQAGLAGLALRQGRLVSRPWLPMHVVITEGALRTQLGTPQVMAEQWARLTTLTTHYAVTVRVLPNARSGLISTQHGWRTLDFSNTPEPRWLIRRYGRVNAPTAIEGEVATAYGKYLQLRAAALSADDSLTFIQQLIFDSPS